jgi:hypothetical protein
MVRQAQPESLGTSIARVATRCRRARSGQRTSTARQTQAVDRQIPERDGLVPSPSGQVSSLLRIAPDSLGEHSGSLAT